MYSSLYTSLILTVNPNDAGKPDGTNNGELGRVKRKRYLKIAISATRLERQKTRDNTEPQKTCEKKSSLPSRKGNLASNPVPCAYCI
jgi:hypothetical protein